MFLKCSPRQKDGKEHRSWSVVESRRLGRRVGQRHVLYLGEINDSQHAAWPKAIAVFDEQDGQSRQCAATNCANRSSLDRHWSAYRAPGAFRRGICVQCSGNSLSSAFDNS